MVRRNKRLTKEETAQVFVLREQGHSMQKVADLLGISKGAVHKILHNNTRSEQHERLVNDYKKVKEESNKQIIEMMQGNMASGIVDTALGKLTSENMDKDIDRAGIGNIYRIVGMFTDKVLAIKDQTIREKQLDIRLKELEIKEKELELRISDPHAFAPVTIVNDAPPDKEVDYAKPNTS